NDSQKVWRAEGPAPLSPARTAPPKRQSGRAGEATGPAIATGITVRTGSPCCSAADAVGRGHPRGSSAGDALRIRLFTGSSAVIQEVGGWSVLVFARRCSVRGDPKSRTLWRL